MQPTTIFKVPKILLLLSNVQLEPRNSRLCCCHLIGCFAICVDKQLWYILVHFWYITTTNKVAESARCLCIFTKIMYFMCTLYVNHLHISLFSPFQSHFFQVESEESLFFHYYGFTVRSVKISLRTSRLLMSFDGL